MGLLTKLHDKLVSAAMRGMGTLLPFVSDQRLVDTVKKRIDTEVPYPEGRDFITKMLLTVKEFFPKLSKNVRKKAVEVFLVNAEVHGAKIRESLKGKLGYWAPFLFVVSPTMRCNLRCYGCYAGEYEKEDDLPWETLDSIMRQAKEMGIYFIVLSGGEPFIYPHLFKLLETHNDMYFQSYTNGTLIDEPTARRLSELGNFLPCISVEGFQKETDERRGKGHFKKVMQAMENLRKHGVLFGFSATATRQNNDFICSEPFVDFYIQQGCFIGWYFNYIPIGKAPVLDLMPTPQQRIERRRKIAALRRKKDIILADFWCDGTLCGGCIAGGRHYFHINNHGDVEPCVFAHFACDNVKDKPLLEILDSNFFRSFRRRQPYNENLLRPCAIIDNPQVLRDVVKENNAYPTHQDAEQVITEFAPFLDKYAEEYGRLADEEWFNSYLPSLSEEERTTLLNYLRTVKQENESIFTPKEEPQTVE
ncbi:MAG: radical SAM protein [Planctomycetota bacterium]|nr:radical SAM protein [Planctomycetota bacterium]